MIFFGCIGQAGHYAWANEHSRARDRWFDHVDGTFVPRSGKGAALHHLFDDTMTILAFVDQAVDTRPGSNGAFIEDGHLTREQMIERAYEQFPNVAKRVNLTALAEASR